MTPLPANTVLEGHFLEVRSKLLDLAAILDRIDRGGGVNDPRLDRLRQAVELLSAGGPDQAAKVQELFSLPYDPSWERPTPR